MKAQDLVGKYLKNYCCKKCGGVLDEIYDQATGPRIICGTNKCYPLEVETKDRRTIEMNSKVGPITHEKIEKSMKSLFPEEI